MSDIPYPVEIKFKKAKEVGPWGGGRKELLDKPNGRQNNLQLGSPGERRGCIILPTSPLLFPPISFSWVLFLRFLFLLNSFH